MPLFVLLALWISNAVSETLRPGEYFTLYTKNFYEFPGAEITLKGAYEFCNPTYCPRCIRVMYLKFGKLAKCSGGKDPSKLRNCWKYNFAVKARVPMKYGFSRITAHSLLGYRCGTIPNNAKGVLVGTIRVGNPLFCRTAYLHCLSGRHNLGSRVLQILQTEPLLPWVST